MTGTNFFLSSVTNGVVGVDGVVISINVFLFEEGELLIVTSLVDTQETGKLLHEILLLEEREGFLVFNLFSEELQEGKSELVVLESFNVVTVLSASSGK